MRTWDDYKNHVNSVDPEIAKDIKETEEIAAIVSVMVEQRNGKASVNGKVFDFEPMTMICAFLGEMHQIINNGDELLKVFCIFL